MCFIGACTTTEEELVLAALVLEAGLQGSPGTASRRAKKLVVPGDLAIVERMRQGGLWALYEKAGFRIGARRLLHVPGRGHPRRPAGTRSGCPRRTATIKNRMGAGSLA